jgi:hypothetical protein
LGQVDAGDVRRLAREQRRAVSLAAGDVEHALAGDEAAREVIAMPVLDPDLALHARDEALAGEGQVVAGAVVGVHRRHPRRRMTRRAGCR